MFPSHITINGREEISTWVSLIVDSVFFQIAQDKGEPLG